MELANREIELIKRLTGQLDTARKWHGAHPRLVLTDIFNSVFHRAILPT